MKIGTAWVTALASALLIVACSSGGAATSVPSEVASLGPTSGPASPGPTTPLEDEPPAGQLSAGRDPVTAFQGSYCWNSTCADVFDTPPAADLPLVVAKGDGLTFSLAGAETFRRWSASYRANDADDVTPLAEGGSDYDPDTAATTPPLTEADFDAPPAGDWVLIVQVFSEEGDAQYMWHVVVE